ncbi:hypothetical protein RRG08_032376 [Elysia crispata]|uniref:Uncharacterized protein n=1 Tax=Elysia crispata TaxID=231223 RepID=A0AAE1AH47_9GAST|nr:hypothetical protein RRG08_032376 [Elysia crispata]
MLTNESTTVDGPDEPVRRSSIRHSPQEWRHAQHATHYFSFIMDKTAANRRSVQQQPTHLFDLYTRRASFVCYPVTVSLRALAYVYDVISCVPTLY